MQRVLGLRPESPTRPTKQPRLDAPPTVGVLSGGEGIWRSGTAETAHLPRLPDLTAESRAPTPQPPPLTGLDSSAPHSVVTELIGLYLTHLWPRLPIVYPPRLRENWNNRIDRTDPACYCLMLNILAATAICCRPMPENSILQAAGLTWVSAARHFNTALRARSERIHQLARNGGAVFAVQNLLFVAVLERGWASRVADRIIAEAERFASTYCLGFSESGLDNGEDPELRRRMYWSLYTNDKIRSILFRQPMTIRSDEADILAPVALPDEERELTGFRELIRICQAAEHGILVWRQDLRSGDPASCGAHLNESLKHVLHVSQDVVQALTSADGLAFANSVLLYSYCTECAQSPSCSNEPR